MIIYINPYDEEDILDVKEKELNKYRNEVDNLFNNFKTKIESNNNSINTTNKNQLFNSLQNSVIHLDRSTPSCLVFFN